ncbi:unnamed protein product [Prorocentrum cordatum]|uniref:DnaJ homolog subfamily C member 21 n=1 Tax=Prorocentrum cordatum TaxID=2364126 RepID=A0ABN9SC06_9DINO|nr:unnamed protein product [Polarella glacialis]|mmetsp:Transcript_106767/g.278765  ORF Transcript_106767/g.278765 Transcript_106767/m.278765 type:complete len:543 (-) Transcript_106767:133-1761(-)
MKQCFYEVLGVERSCTLDQLRSAYRKLALKHHPDKAQPEERKEATERFQIILEAYETLKDPHERAWYDAHRDQILRGEEDVDGEPKASKVAVWSLFRRGAFKEFDDSHDGFYAVYREAFETLASEEAEASDGEPMIYFSFGTRDTPWQDVSKFYRQWCDFVSVKSFAEMDKYRPQDAPNRQIRRVMEQENKKLRASARKDFMTAVRRLAERCRKWDPRVEQHQKEEAAKAKEAAVERAERQERDKADKAAAREKARAEEAARWAARPPSDEGEEEDEEESEDEEILQCVACRKTFKTQAAYASHERSKKHLQMVAKLKREMEEEDDEDTDEEGPAEPAPAQATCAPVKAKAQAKAEDLFDLEAGEGGVDLKSLIDALPATSRPGPAAALSADEDADSAASDSDSDAGLARLARGRTAARASAGATPPTEEAAEAPAELAAEEAAADGEEAGGVSAEAEEADRRARKPRRRAKDATPPSVQPAVVNGGYPVANAKCVDETTTCRTCGAAFDSRSKLFAHIEKSGHGIIKMTEPTGKKGKTKKR